MAAIDSLLKLMESQGADTLVIATGEAPVLCRAGAPVRLSMQAISEEMVAAFVSEVLIETEPRAESAGSEPLAGYYITDDGKAYAFEIGSLAQGLRLTLRSGGGKGRNGTDGVAHELPASKMPFISAPLAGPVSTASTPPFTEPAVRASAVPSGASAVDPLVLSAISEAVERGASDIFLSEGIGIRVRVGGKIEPVFGINVTEQHLRQLIDEELTLEGRDRWATTGNTDAALALELANGPMRFRLNLFQQQRGLAAVLRPIRTQIPTLRELNLPFELHELCHFRHGLVLMTGPAGSGKSTTLAALVEYLNQTEPRHIITLEDPIEYEYANKASLIHQREVGQHVESFGVGLRAALRESPDVILLGEMRDLPTIEAALTAAETGHLVLSTLHTGSAPAAVDRIVDVFPGHQQPQVQIQLAATLRAVVTQFLLPSRTPPQRMPAIEKLIVNEAVACQIREGRNHQVTSLIQAGRDEGMITLERSLAALVRSKRITRQVALEHARDKDSLLKLVA